MISVEDFDTRYPNLNNDYFSTLSIEDKDKYIKRYIRYHKKLLDMVIEKLKISDIEKSLQNSKRFFKPVKEDEYDLYQYLASDKLMYIYLRNNLYIERLTNDELLILDDDSVDITDIVSKTFRKVISDFGDEEVITNYGPDSKHYLCKSSNLIFGIRIDEDFFPANLNKLELILGRDHELKFLQIYLVNKTKQILGVDASAIIYNKNSVRILKNKDANRLYNMING